ncbi:hypothetical protein ACFQJD_14615 [Haloplanus sp. GCM10025708]|uniref:hypothetical protein n=1 Tax=Haloferacaceae TaxID=1644056 RepID=UPI00361E3EAC
MSYHWTTGARLALRTPAHVDHGGVGAYVELTDAGHLNVAFRRTITAFCARREYSFVVTTESRPTDEVHLTATATEGESTIESAIATDRIDFYDAGVSRDTGRDFFPYERIRLIREGVGPETGPSDSTESDSTERDAAASVTEAADDHLDVDELPYQPLLPSSGERTSSVARNTSIFGLRIRTPKR